MTEEIQSIQNNELDAWLDSLYKATFDVVFEGKKLVFNKRFPTGIAFELQKKPQDQQLYEFITILAVQPKITIEQAKRLPQDLVMAFAQELEKYFDFEQVKKATPPRL